MLFIVYPQVICWLFFFFQAEDGIRDDLVTGVQTCALPICAIRVNGLFISCCSCWLIVRRAGRMGFRHGARLLILAADYLKWSWPPVTIVLRLLCVVVLLCNALGAEIGRAHV